MSQPPQIRRRAFVLRVWQDETGHVWGQITEPVSEWRRPFASADELWALLMNRLDISTDHGSLQMKISRRPDR